MEQVHKRENNLILSMNSVHRPVNISFAIVQVAHKMNASIFF